MIWLAHRRFHQTLCALSAFGLAVLLLSNLSWGYTPDSPEVRKMIDRGVAYLEQHGDNRLGGRCLIGMVFNKEGHPESHPRIREAVQACKESCAATPRDIYMKEGNYSIGLALIFLCELNPDKHDAEIKKLLATLAVAQKPHGGWGYSGKPHPETGDTSMTQYAVLGLWTADRAGKSVNVDSVRRVCTWLIRTQDPSGAWGYQGHIAEGGGSERVEQTEIRPSMAAAGLGSVYVCAEILGVSKQVADAELEKKVTFPAAFKPVQTDPGQRQRALAVAVPIASLIKRATLDGNQWFEENFVIDAPSWGHYYLYGLERYKSFRELAENKEEAEPDWYNLGVEFLSKKQNDDGRWPGQCGGSIDTAFAALFLMRSTKKSINKAVNYGDGRLTGGRGLPTDIRNIRVKQGKIVSEPLGGNADDVLALLEDPDNPKFDALVDNPESVILSAGLASGGRELERLRRVIRGGNFGARQVAVKALAVRRDLDNVPVLVYALSDPDARVAREARNALRFISRKFEGFGMPDEPTLEDKLVAVRSWKKWYLSIRPDAEFLD